MPFKIKKVQGGYKVASPSGAKSKKPMSREKARRQQSAIYANWTGESLADRIDRAITEIFPDTGEGGPYGDGREPSARGFATNDVRLISADDETINYELGAGAYRHIIRRQADGEDLNNIIDDMGLGSTDQEWDAVLRGTRLTIVREACY